VWASLCPCAFLWALSFFFFCVGLTLTFSFPSPPQSLTERRKPNSQSTLRSGGLTRSLFWFLFWTQASFSSSSCGLGWSFLPRCPGLKLPRWNLILSPAFFFGIIFPSVASLVFSEIPAFLWAEISHSGSCPFSRLINVFLGRTWQPSVRFFLYQPCYWGFSWSVLFLPSSDCFFASSKRFLSPLPHCSFFVGKILSLVLIVDPLSSFYRIGFLAFITGNFLQAIFRIARSAVFSPIFSLHVFQFIFSWIGAGETRWALCSGRPFCVFNAKKGPSAPSSPRPSSFFEDTSFFFRRRLSFIPLPEYDGPPFFHSWQNSSVFSSWPKQSPQSLSRFPWKQEDSLRCSLFPQGLPSFPPVPQFSNLELVILFLTTCHCAPPPRPREEDTESFFSWQDSRQCTCPFLGLGKNLFQHSLDPTPPPFDGEYKWRCGFLLQIAIFSKNHPTREFGWGPFYMLCLHSTLGLDFPAQTMAPPIVFPFFAPYLTVLSCLSRPFCVLARFAARFLSSPPRILGFSARSLLFLNKYVLWSPCRSLPFEYCRG